MTKIKRVLSDDDFELIIKNGAATKNGVNQIEICRLVEQAVLAKLAEQKPVAWRITAKRFCGEFTHDRSVAQHWIESEPERVTPLYAQPCVAPVSDKPSCDSQNEIYETQIPDGTLIDEGTKEQHRTSKNHIPDAGKMIEHESHSLEFEVRTMVEMLEAKEWAEHCGKSDLGQRLEWAITSLHNEAQIIPKIIPDGWQLVPKEPSRDILKKMFYEIFGMDGIEEEYLAARYRNMLSLFPKYTEVIND